MNIPTEDELIDLLERCWNAASKAKISNGPMTFEQKDQTGRCYVDTMRVQTFYNLVAHLLSKSVAPVLPKEPWQGE